MENKGNLNEISPLFFKSVKIIAVILIYSLIFILLACEDNKSYCNLSFRPIIQNENAKNEYLNAAKNGNTELVKSYISKGNSESMWTAYDNRFERPIPTRSGPVVDENGQTALILASANGHVDVVKLFTIERPECFSTVDINHKDNNGKTALMGAREAGHTNIVDLLIRAGADDT